MKFVTTSHKNREKKRERKIRDNYLSQKESKRERERERQREILLLILNLVVTSRELNFHSLHKRFKCTANTHRELNFCH